MPIKLLTSEIINQIAAGEVIENPSAVIKELVENSIDAKATQIDIDIDNYGLSKMVITDNGVGIEKDDLLKAPLRHATSKIENFNDLYNIRTMGFRGEALASIFSVSKAKITSKTKDSDIAYEISSENINEVKEGGGSFGTSIVVEDIFYNTPARKKYLKSNNLEFKSILDIMNRFEVFYHNIKFTLRHNNKIVINKPAFDNIEDNIYYVLGRELKGNLVYFENETDGIKVSGFLGKPADISYSFRKNQYLYVNSRYIKSKIIRDAVYDGFGTNLMVGRHPFFVLFIDIDPEVVDVNVHPTKIEIKFENELEIYEFIRKSVSDVFMKTETFKSFERELVSVEKDIDLSDKISDIRPQISSGKKPGIEKSYFSKEVQKPIDIRENSYSFQKDLVLVKEDSSMDSSSSTIILDQDKYEEKYEDELNDEKGKYNLEHIENTKTIEKKFEYGPLYETLKDYRIVGQVNKTFIILETKTDMIVVDQHVAEEKFFFEMFKEKIENSSVKSQTLLKPEVLTLSKQEMILYEENIELIKKLGFISEVFGANEIMVRAVPIDINKKTLDPKLLLDLLHEITVDNKFKTLEEEKIEKLASMSCRRSIKAGDELTIPQIHKIIENLKRLKEPFNCPHGRPILLQYPFSELEKKFKRIL